MIYIPVLSRSTESVTLQSFNHFGNREESGTVTLVTYLTNYEDYLHSLSKLETVGSLRVDVNYVKNSKFVTLFVDYSNKKDLDTIMDLKIEKKNAPSHEEILPSGTVLNIPSGGTFEACPDGKLLKVSCESGYAVGTQGIQIKSSELTDSILADLAKKYNSEFVGYWISEGICYVDCVEIVDDLAEAIFLAVKFNQLEIYDFSNHTCYEIGPNQIDEKSYFCNVVRRYNIDSRDIVIVSELVDQYGSEEFVTGCELSDSESLREFNVKYNPMRKIDSGIVQYVNQSQSQSRRENNVNGRDVS
jgi:hypothetical protein